MNDGDVDAEPRDQHDEGDRRQQHQQHRLQPVAVTNRRRAIFFQRSSVST
jgi:hypothetical protein